MIYIIGFMKPCMVKKEDLDNLLDMETNEQIIRETELQIKEMQDRKQDGERIRANKKKSYMMSDQLNIFSTW